MKLVLVLLMCVTSAIGARVARWANRYGKPLNFQCKSYGSIGRIESSFNADLKDRVWDFSCKSTFRKVNSCYWSSYVNDFRQRIEYTCPIGSVLSGMRSYHDDGQKDRRWSFMCCWGKIQRQNCQWSNYVNEFEKDFTWRTSLSSYLVGISSYYDNKHKDRSWTFCTCEK